MFLSMKRKFIRQYNHKSNTDVILKITFLARVAVVMGEEAKLAAAVKLVVVILEEALVVVILEVVGVVWALTLVEEEVVVRLEGLWIKTRKTLSRINSVLLTVLVVIGNLIHFEGVGKIITSRDRTV